MDMQNPSIGIVKRHFIGSEEEIPNLDYIACGVYKAAMVNRGFYFGINISYKEFPGFEDERERIEKKYRDYNNLYCSFSPEVETSGPGESLRQNLFEFYQNAHAVNPDIVVSLDGDQYSLYPKMLELIDYFAQELASNDSVLGLGFRTNPDFGSEKAGMYREVHEHLMTSMNDSFVVHNPENLDIKNPAYKKFGDAYPGCYFVNLKSDNYESLCRWVEDTRKTADFRYFTFDYSTILYLGCLGNIPAVVVPTEKNESGSRSLDRVVNHIIVYQTAEVMKTSVGSRLKRHLESEETINEVAEFYPREEVERVADWMLNPRPVDVAEISG